MSSRLAWFLLLAAGLLLACCLRAHAQLVPPSVYVPLELPGWQRSPVLLLPAVNLNAPRPRKAGIVVEFLPTPAPPKPAAPARSSRAMQAANGGKLVQWLVERLSIREATGRNDGPAVTALILAGGGQPGWPWCGYTQLAAHKACRLAYPAGAAKASNWFVDPKRTYFKAGARGLLDSLKPGHAIGLSYGSGINHVTGVVEIVPPLRKGRPPRGAWCIGGNEGRGANAGVHRTMYAGPAIVAASNYNY